MVKQTKGILQNNSYAGGMATSGNSQQRINPNLARSGQPAPRARRDNKAKPISQAQSQQQPQPQQNIATNERLPSRTERIWERMQAVILSQDIIQGRKYELLLEFVDKTDYLSEKSEDFISKYELNLINDFEVKIQNIKEQSAYKQGFFEYVQLILNCISIEPKKMRDLAENLLQRIIEKHSKEENEFEKLLDVTINELKSILWSLNIQIASIPEEAIIYEDLLSMKEPKPPKTEQELKYENLAKNYGITVEEFHNYAVEAAEEGISIQEVINKYT